MSKTNNARLPAELTLETFRYMPIDDRVAARGVCRSWRRLSDACPVTVPAHLAQQPARLRCYLDQMKAAPLLYEEPLAIDDRNLDILAPAIATHMKHTIIFDMRLSVDFYYREDTSTELAVLTTDSTSLKRLRLQLDRNWTIETKDLFPCSTSITHLYLDGCCAILSAFWHTSLRILVLNGIFTWDDMEIVFGDIEHLEDLALGIDDADFMCDVPPGTVLETHLARLSLSFSERVNIADIEIVLASFDHGSIGAVSFTHRNADQQSAARILEALSTPDIVSLDLSCTAEACALRLSSSDGRKRVHTGLSLGTLANLLRTTPLDVSTLVVSGGGYLSPIIETLGTFDGLRELTVLVEDTAPRFMPPIISPALEEITFATTQRNYDRRGSLSLLADDVRGLLRDSLLCQDLRALRFRGVSVDDPSDLGSLAGRVDVQQHLPLVCYVYPEEDRRSHRGQGDDSAS